ncbi:hypothetical protein F5Y00DRAFT_238863 [Daldinia vernicosa]|uniref:uncharacterized protein n=1 Tax=Daldinia vernicosa TaxID=114800 RepID=UPI002007A1CD|nr:uncharacterized protein F5Y00DRAFT_238863 [Daldinia vernicosa]KAI0848330.1 hypothetical protein F5Y00DRAFT_238863 [Daldinia vernicosa]
MVSPVGTFFIVLVVLLIVAAVGWIVFTQLRARRLGLPAPPLSSYIPFAHSEPSSSYGPPQPAPSGIRSWISDKWRALRSSGNRSASGAYERPSRRGFGPLDPDEAWDSRVGHEADGYYGYGYEEQELGLRGQGQRQQQQQQQHENGTGYSTVNLGADERRGRTLSRDQGAPIGGNGNGNLGIGGGRNPFDDEAAEPSNISLRGVSPRPIDTNVAATKAIAGAKHDSPTSERRSIFREEV